MNRLIDTFVTLVVVSVFAFTGLGIVSLGIQKRNAEIFLDKAVYEISTSDFSETVINNVKTSANESGYRLEVSPQTIVEDKRVYKATLHYDLSLALLSIDNNGEISSFIR